MKFKTPWGTQSLDNLLGSKGEMSRGVFKHTIGRPDVDLKAHDASVRSFAGFNTWAAWQGTPERAAVAGDFAMLENEVASVIKALVENGIEVVVVHNPWYMKSQGYFSFTIGVLALMTN